MNRSPKKTLVPFLKRILLVLPATYILFYYSELLFWAKYDPVEISPAGLLITYVFYFLITYAFLSVIVQFRVRTFWALFLAGAIYGWLIEGVIVQTMYEDFPLNISWTGLAWHSLISVIIGWYYILDILLQNNYRKTVGASVLIGLFYGVWAINWWVEEGIITPLSEFSLYVVSTSVILIGSYWLYNRLQPEFQPTRIEGHTLAVFFIVWFILVTILVQPVALFVLPPLLAMVYVTLRRNRKTERNEPILTVLQGEVTPLNYVILLIIPLVTIGVYGFAVSLNLAIPTNWVVYMVTTLSGFILLVMSISRIFKPR
jgi:hypothetical protein